MSEPLRTHTERTRDQRRIEALEAELSRAMACIAEREDRLEDMAECYTHVLEALADAREWRAHAALYALGAGMLAVMLLKWIGP